MGGMALGTASFDEAGGARMMRTATNLAGSGISNITGAIQNVRGDKKTQQYLKNHGTSSVASDGTYDYLKLKYELLT